MKQIISFSKGLNQGIDESVLPVDYASLMYGFECKSGALKLKYFMKDNSCFSASVLAEVNELEEIKRLFYFKKYDNVNNSNADKLIIIDGDLSVHYIELFDDNQSLVSLGITFNAVPEGVSYRLNGEDVFIFASESDSMVVWDGTNSPYSVLDAPKITSMALHNERLFVSSSENKNRLWFSDDLDPTNWNISMEDAGFIDMYDERGAIVKVLSFNGYLYIFRDYGISRLSASGGQEGFYLNHLFVSAGKIYEKTISLCGDRVIFAASDGIYSFDGLTTVKILNGVYPLLSGYDEGNSAFYNGKYYLTCKGDFDGVTDNVIFLYEVKDKKFVVLRGENVTSMTVINSGDFDSLVLNNAKTTPNLCEIADFSVSEEDKIVFSGLWKHGLSDFGDPVHDKTIRAVHIVSNVNLVLKIFSEREETSINIVPGVYSYPCILSGRKFGFAISCDSLGAVVSDLVIMY